MAYIDSKKIIFDLFDSIEQLYVNKSYNYLKKELEEDFKNNMATIKKKRSGAIFMKDARDSFKFLDSKTGNTQKRHLSKYKAKAKTPHVIDAGIRDKLNINEIYLKAVDQKCAPFIRCLTPLSEIDEKGLPSPRTKNKGWTRPNTKQIQQKKNELKKVHKPVDFNNMIGNDLELYEKKKLKNEKFI